MSHAHHRLLKSVETCIDLIDDYLQEDLDPEALAAQKKLRDFYVNLWRNRCRQSLFNA